MTFSDSNISNILQKDFVVCWQSVSPVRVVTFDLGGGRSFTGTVNGEIALYFCLPNGDVFDILPALQSPAVTLDSIKNAKSFHTRLQKLLKDARTKRNKASKTNKENQPKISPSPLPEYLFSDKYIIHQSIASIHQERMKQVAGKRFDKLLKDKVQIHKRIKNIPAEEIFPLSKKGEQRRDRYISAAVDHATGDMRRMIYSKVASPGSMFKNDYTGDAITVVEPGGKGYYQWQIGRKFLGINLAPEEQVNDNKLPLFGDTSFVVPPEKWKKVLFETIMKQELKGGKVKYNSDSLEAISIIEE